MILRTRINLILLPLLLSCDKSKEVFQAFKNSQDYNVPLWKDDQKNKVALMVFPHPDDEIVCAGSVAQLKANGWQVNLITLTKGKAEEKEIRNAEWKEAVKKLKFDNYEIFDLINNSWDNVMSNKIEFWYNNSDSIANVIMRSINKYKPSIIFTYDSVIGAYGHPEHRMTSQVINRIFQKNKNDSSFTVQSVLQITLPEKMEVLMFGKAPSYKNAIEITGYKTLPEPTVAFNILPYWFYKHNASKSYVSQESTLRKFYLWPDAADTLIHYNSFDREYYYETKR